MQIKNNTTDLSQYVEAQNSELSLLNFVFQGILMSLSKVVKAEITKNYVECF